jgi:hypothetical protein
MTPSELKAAREKYAYVPARLIRASAAAADLRWKSLNLIVDIPKNWDAGHNEIRSQYSSWSLDEFHRALLQSDNEEDLFHALLSVVFWGFASGSNGRLNAPRALSRAKASLIGRKNSAPQAANEIISHLRRSRELLTTSRIAEALALPAGTVMSRLSRGKAQLRAFLGEAAAGAENKIVLLSNAQIRANG